MTTRHVADDYEGLEYLHEKIEAIIVYNGYIHFLSYSAPGDSIYYEDFIALLGSVVFTDDEGLTSVDSVPGGLGTEGTDDANQNNSDSYVRPPSFGDLVLSFILTVAIYSLPIILFRYAIRKRPVSRGIGLVITIVYGFVALIILIIISNAIGSGGSVGSAIFLWSFINYLILTRRKTSQPEEAQFIYDEKDTVVPPQNESADQPVIYSPPENSNSDFTEAKHKEIPPANTPSEQEEAREENGFCRRCGNNLYSDSLFCTKCGTRVPMKNGVDA